MKQQVIQGRKESRVLNWNHGESRLERNMENKGETRLPRGPDP